MTDHPDPTQAPPGAPANIYGADGRPRFFADPAMDRFAAAFSNLVGEVWVTRELLANLIDLACKKGFITAEEIAAHAATAGEAAREAELKAYVHRVLGPLREGG
jgi:hypothetical protein